MPTGHPRRRRHRRALTFVFLRRRFDLERVVALGAVLIAAAMSMFGNPHRFVVFLAARFVAALSRRACGPTGGPITEQMKKADPSTSHFTCASMKASARCCASCAAFSSYSM
jgi:hypothetical protein